MAVKRKNGMIYFLIFSNVSAIVLIVVNCNKSLIKRVLQKPVKL